MAGAVITQGVRPGPTATEIQSAFAGVVGELKAAGATDDDLDAATKNFNPSAVRGPSECDEALVGTGVVSSYTVPSIESLKSDNDSANDSPGGSGEVVRTSTVVADGSTSKAKSKSKK